MSISSNANGNLAVIKVLAYSLVELLELEVISNLSRGDQHSYIYSGLMQTFVFSWDFSA